MLNQEYRDIELIFVNDGSTDQSLAIAEKFAYEKRLIVKELARYSIHSILTTPQNLSVNTINKYLELKARRLI